MIKFAIKEHKDIDAGLKWADMNATKALAAGEVEMVLQRPARSNDQNAKLWAMCSDFEPIEFNGRHWNRENWKCFLLSAFNQEMPAIGLLGEPVSMSLSSSNLGKKRFAVFIESIYAEGCKRDVVWSEKALAVYDEYKEVK